MFLPPDDRTGAVAWRGPMLHRTLNQFLTDVHFGDLDVLLVDSPPGTGDVAISLGQLLPSAEVLVVTTPQAAAADVAVRSGLVARRLGQRVIGVVETMAPAVLPDGSVLDLFGSGGGEAVAARLSTPDEPVALLALRAAQRDAAARRRHRDPGRAGAIRPIRPRSPSRGSPRRSARGPAGWRGARCRSGPASGVRSPRSRRPRPGRAAAAARCGPRRAPAPARSSSRRRRRGARAARRG